MALNPLRKFSTRSGSDSDGGEKSVSIVKQRALRRIIQAKRRIVKQTKEKARRETKKRFRPPIREAGELKKSNFRFCAM